MTPAFWDTSALVPLCVQQRSSSTVHQLLSQYEIVVWWATQVEMRSAFERLLRVGPLTQAQHTAAGTRLERLRLSWREMRPSDRLREKAQGFLSIYPLKAADSLQLAAAWVWSSGAPQGCAFLSGDAQLLDAAAQVGFQTITV